MSAELRIEERTQSGGTTITSRRDELLTVHVLADRRPAPRNLTRQVLILELEARGWTVGLDDAIAIARRILAAEAYRPSGECCAVDARD